MKKEYFLILILESYMIQIQIQTLTNSNFDEKDPYIDHSAPGDGRWRVDYFFSSGRGRRDKFFRIPLEKQYYTFIDGCFPWGFVC